MEEKSQEVYIHNVCTKQSYWTDRDDNLQIDLSFERNQMY